VATVYTDNGGVGKTWLSPVLYAVAVDLPGYSWGDLGDKEGEADIPVQSGGTRQVLIRLGRLVVGLRDGEGEAAVDEYFEVYTQGADLNGKPVVRDRIWGGYTDNSGTKTLDLTEGTYALKVGDSVLYGISVLWGVVTQTDGTTFSQQ
jgi:hypothetical protein